MIPKSCKSLKSWLNFSEKVIKAEWVAVSSILFSQFFVLGLLLLVYVSDVVDAKGESCAVQLQHMASNKSPFEVYLSCPVCGEVFKDPVVITCNHSVCQACLHTLWDTRGSRECPVCGRKSSQDCPPVNLVLKSLCENLPQGANGTASNTALGDSGIVCGLHGEKLKLFCVDTHEPVCVVCRDSKTHKDHTFSPIDEAASELKVRD